MEDENAKLRDDCAKLKEGATAKESEIVKLKAKLARIEQKKRDKA